MKSLHQYFPLAHFKQNNDFNDHQDKKFFRTSFICYTPIPPLSFNLSAFRSMKHLSDYGLILFLLDLKGCL